MDEFNSIDKISMNGSAGHQKTRKWVDHNSNLTYQTLIEVPRYFVLLRDTIASKSREHPDLFSVPKHAPASQTI